MSETEHILYNCGGSESLAVDSWLLYAEFQHQLSVTTSTQTAIIEANNTVTRMLRRTRHKRDIMEVKLTTLTAEQQSSSI